MKLLLLDKSEIVSLNINYLFQGNIKVVYTRQDFVESLNTVESIGFTTKAIRLFSSAVSFSDMLEAIQVLYKQHLYYFSETIDALTLALNTNNNASILKSITNYSEYDISKIFNDKTPIHLDLPELSRTTLTPATIRSYSNYVKDFQKKTNPTKDEQEKYQILKHLLTSITTNKQYKLNNMLLTSQRNLSTELLKTTQDRLDQLLKQYEDLLECYNTNLTTQTYYKTAMDKYADTLDYINKHGIQNLNEDCFLPIHTGKTSYPINVLYFKQVTTCRYLHTYVKSLARILTNIPSITKVIYLYPEYSSMVSRHLHNFYDVKNLTESSYANHAFFISYGDTHTVLSFMLDNHIPIDNLIIVDFTSLDRIHCNGSNVHMLYCASDYKVFSKLAITPVACITNEQSTEQNAFALLQDADFESYNHNKVLIDLKNEQLPLTAYILSILGGGSSNEEEQNTETN